MKMFPKNYDQILYILELMIELIQDTVLRFWGLFTLILPQVLFSLFYVPFGVIVNFVLIY